MNTKITVGFLIAALTLSTASAHADDRDETALKALAIGGVVVIGGAAIARTAHHNKHHEKNGTPDHRFDQGLFGPTTIPLEPGPVILPQAIGSGVAPKISSPAPVGAGASPRQTPTIGHGVSPQSEAPRQYNQMDLDSPYRVD